MKNNTIGKRIAEARINRNITQEHLEELSGLSVSTISRIETGKYMPTRRPGFRYRSPSGFS